MTRCFDTGVVAEAGGLELSLAFILEADLVCGGGVGNAFGAMDEGPAALNCFDEYGDAPVSSLGNLAELLFRGVTLLVSACAPCALDSPDCCEDRAAAPWLPGTIMSAME